MTKAIKHPVWFILFILLLCINIYSIFWARQIFSEPFQIKAIPSFEMGSKDQMILSEKPSSILLQWMIKIQRLN